MSLLDMSTESVNNQNRHKLSQFFITFPRWKTYEDLTALHTELPPSKWCYIVQELHDDEDLDLERNSMVHYHVSIILRNPVTKKKLLNWIQLKFPSNWKRVDVSATKNFEATILYMMKESTIFLETGVRPKTLAQRKAVSLQKFASRLTPEQIKSEIIHGVAEMMKEERRFYIEKKFMMIYRYLGYIDYNRESCIKFLEKMRCCKGR